MTGHEEIIGELRDQRDFAITLLANWVASIEINGSDWDSWDHHFKNAKRGGGGDDIVKYLLIEKINKIKKEWDDDWGDDTDEE